MSQSVRQVMSLVTMLVLARLLVPSDFGLMGMVLVFNGFLMIFKDLGTSAAVISSKNISEGFLNSVFWLNVGFGIVMTVLVYFLAPFGAGLFGEPRLIELLKVMALAFFVSSLGVLQQALLERSLAFQTLAIVETFSIVTGALVGIIMAIAGAGVWSLVFQSLAIVSVTTLMLWHFNKWRPAVAFHWNEIRQVSGYSLNLVGFSMLNYVSRNADNFLIGRFLGAQELGYYALAYRILLLPIQSITAVIGRVMFPIYSSVKGDSQRFANIYLKIATTIALITFPLMMGVMALASPLVAVAFGDEWRPIVILITILAPLGLTQSIGSTVGLIYLTSGRTDWMFRWGIVASITILIAFSIGLTWGVVGVASAYLIASLCLLYPSYAISFSLIELRFVDLLKALRRPFLNSLMMFAILSFLRTYVLQDFPAVFVLSVLIPTGISFYIGVNWLNNRRQLIDLWVLARSGVEH